MEDKRTRSLNVIKAGIVLVLLAVVFTGVFLFCTSIKDAGQRVGSAAGNIVGLAVGSFEGITRGIEEGVEAGKEQGITAEDTTVSIANKIQATGKLDVLAVEGQIVDDFTQGNDYQAWFVYKATAIFSINLGDIAVTEQNGSLLISVPEPVCEVSIDQSESKELASWQKYFWTGDTDAAYKGYLNSMSQIQEIAKTQMEEQYLEQSKIAAQKAISQIADSASGGKYQTVDVVFREEEE